MSELFLNTVNISASASWLILAVLGSRLVLQKAPKWVRVLLWGFVAVRLLLPVSIESAFSLIPSAQMISEAVLSGSNREIQIGIGFADGMAALPNPAVRTVEVLSIVWLIGMLLLMAYAVNSYQRFRRRVDTAVLLRENIFQCETVDSPCVLGMIRPKIYLTFKMDAKALEYVVTHEQAHIRRGDHWWKPLGFLLLTVHWFNPLVWLAYVLLCRDIEIACDEKVIKELNNENRADYTQALVACSMSRRRIAACPLAFGEVGVKERVKAIMNYQKPAPWRSVLAVATCAVVAVCFLTDPVMAADVLEPGSASQEVHSKDVVIPIQALFEESTEAETRPKEPLSIEEIQKMQEELEEKLDRLLEEARQLWEEERNP